MFEVGDRVFCEDFGQGEVISITGNNKGRYPIIVSFDLFHPKVQFTLKGKVLSKKIRELEKLEK